MKVAVAQICSTKDIEANLKQVAEQCAAAAAQEADLVVFPEATMRAFGHNLTEIAEPLDGPFATRVSEIAAEHDLTVLVGMFTPGTGADAGTKVRNTLLAASPDGTRTGYDKIHLFDAFGFSESDTVEAGDQRVRIEIDGTTVGLAICYDVRFPQLFIENARDGADLQIVCASWGAGEGKVAQWELLARASALDSTSWVIACGQADPTTCGVEAVPGAPTGVGHSLIADPTGQVVSAADAAPQLLVADIDLSGVEEVRRSIPVLSNARLS